MMIGVLFQDRADDGITVLRRHVAGDLRADLGDAPEMPEQPLFRDALDDESHHMPPSPGHEASARVLLVFVTPVPPLFRLTQHF